MLKSILFNPTSAMGHHGCTLVARQLEHVASAAGIEIAARIPLEADWDVLAPSQFDLVLVNGEGTLHSNAKGARRIAAIPAWSQKRNVPSFLINTIYEGNGPEIDEAMRGFVGIYTRDRESALALSNVGIDATTTGDLSLTWQPPLGFRDEADQTFVIGSTLASVRSDLYRLSRDIGARYVPILARPAANVTGGNAKRLRKYIAKKAASVVAPPGPWRARWRSAVPDFDDFVALLQSRAKLIVTGRFHGACIAMALGIPVIGVASNTHKMQSLFADVGLSHRLFATVGEARAALETRTLAHYTLNELGAIEQAKSNACTAHRLAMEAITASCLRGQTRIMLEPQRTAI